MTLFYGGYLVLMLGANSKTLVAIYNHLTDYPFSCDLMSDLVICEQKKEYTLVICDIESSN